MIPQVVLALEYSDVSLAFAGLTVGVSVFALAGIGSRMVAERLEQAIRDRLLSLDGGNPTTDFESSESTSADGPGPINDRDTYKLLAEYSSQGLAQSAVSFWASIGAAVLGFAVIITGVLMAIFKEGPGVTEQAIVTVISGAVIDAVSALFFVISARTQRVMVEFFDKLREDRKLEEALTLVKGVPDPLTASRLQVLLALQFVGTADLPDLYKQTVGDHPGGNGTAVTMPSREDGQ